ncbi:MAG: PAS domain S-box protein, partial [Planctomycetaceae bacterium]|nr:PAS domain S-box protein [Planctomycetaceae bacterium]
SEYSGIVADQLTGWRWDRIIHPDDLPTTLAMWHTCLRDGISTDIALRIRRFDGVYRWHICRQLPMRDTSGKIDSWYGTCTDIEDLKRAEQSLRESEERFRLLFEGAADAIFWADAETGVLLQCNRAAEVLLGRQRGEIIGQHQTFLHPGEQFAKYQELFHQHTKSSSSTSIEVEVLRKDGSRVDVAISPSVTTINGQRVIQAIFRDISFRRQTEQSLQMMRFCIDHASDSVFWISRQGKILYVNTAACSERGYTPDEMSEMTIFDLDVEPPYQPESWGDHFEELRSRGSITLETRHRTKDGRIFPVEVNANYVHINNQELNFAFARDITGRRQREQKIAQLAAIVESSDDAIFGITVSGKITSWNRGAEKIFGYAEADVLGCPIERLIVEDRAEQISQVLIRVANGNPMEHFDTVACRSDGSRLDIALSISAVRDAEGQLTGASAVARDVTERKRAEVARDRVETALRRSEERFSKLFYSSSFSILVATYPEGKVVEVNDAFLQLFEFELDEVLGKTTGELNIWVDPEARVTMVDRLLRANSARDMEIAFRTKSGAVLTLLMSVEIIQLQGQPHSLAMSIDNTFNRQIEEQLRQSQKMEAIGQLAGGVAHDFNNLLTVINGYCDILLAETSGRNQWVASVMEIREAGRRAAALTEQLLAFSRRSYTQRKVVQLNDVVSRAEKLLRRLIGEHIILTVNLAPERYAIKADVNQLEQVLMNLVVNGRDAMPEGGSLTITTRAVCVPDPQAPHGSGLHASHVQLDVADTGGGMSDEVRTRVFEPFFTTKESGKGSGLGLAVVHGIVQQNDGAIHVASAPGQGTTFSLLFPIVDASHTEEVTSKHHRLGQGSETILLVEDEPGVRKFTRTVLEIQGYHVLEATNGKEAVALAEHSGIPVHLLLTDVVMPGIDGRLVAEKIRANNPGLRVIYISGYNEVEQFHGNMQNSMDVFLKKPFSPQDLIGRVREHLDAGLD